MKSAPKSAFLAKKSARFLSVSVINVSSKVSFFERNIAIPVRIAIIWTISVKETAPEAALFGRWPDFLGWASRKSAKNREKIKIQIVNADFSRISATCFCCSLILTNLILTNLILSK